MQRRKEKLCVFVSLRMNLYKSLFLLEKTVFHVQFFLGLYVNDFCT